MLDGKKIKFYARYLAVYGCLSTGLIYLGIGVVAIFSFLRLKEGGADETSLLVFLNQFTLGKIFIWIILLGTLSYVIWRIFEAIKDPYEYGGDAKGLAKRTGIGLSSIADVLIAYSAIQVLIGGGGGSEDGRPDEHREMVGAVLQENGGDWLIIIGGIVILVTAVVQLIYGTTQGYKERLAIGHFNSTKQSTIHFLAWVGYVSRGIILGITGFFFVKAGILSEAQHIVNTDKAFDFIGDHIGHVFFILVAAGTICYGFFMFALGITYDAEND